MTIKCDYGKPPYNLCDIVTYQEQTYIVIGYEYNYGGQAWYYQLIPYDEDKLEFAYPEALEPTE